MSSIVADFIRSQEQVEPAEAIARIAAMDLGFQPDLHRFDAAQVTEEDLSRLVAEARNQDVISASAIREHLARLADDAPLNVAKEGLPATLCAHRFVRDRVSPRRGTLERLIEEAFCDAKVMKTLRQGCNADEQREALGSAGPALAKLLRSWAMDAASYDSVGFPLHERTVEDYLCATGTRSAYTPICRLPPTALRALFDLFLGAILQSAVFPSDSMVLLMEPGLGLLKADLNATHPDAVKRPADLRPTLIARDLNGERSAAIPLPRVPLMRYTPRVSDIARRVALGYGGREHTLGGQMAECRAHAPDLDDPLLLVRKGPHPRRSGRAYVCDPGGRTLEHDWHSLESLKRATRPFLVQADDPPDCEPTGRDLRYEQPTYAVTIGGWVRSPRTSEQIGRSVTYEATTGQRPIYGILGGIDDLAPMVSKVGEALDMIHGEQPSTKAILDCVTHCTQRVTESFASYNTSPAISTLRWVMESIGSSAVTFARLLDRGGPLYLPDVDLIRS